MADTDASVLGAKRFTRLYTPAGPFGGTMWFTLRRREFFAAQYRNLHRGEGVKAEPVELRAESGRWLREFVANSESLLLVSAETEHGMTNAGLRGWRTYPVQLYDRQDKAIEGRGFVGLGITGRAGPLDRKCITKLLTRNDGTEVIMGQRGIVFDLDSWDGSDLFLLEDQQSVIVTPRVITVLKSMKAKGWLTESLSDYSLG